MTQAKYISLNAYSQWKPLFSVRNAYNVACRLLMHTYSCKSDTKKVWFCSGIHVCVDLDPKFVWISSDTERRQISSHFRVSFCVALDLHTHETAYYTLHTHIFHSMADGISPMVVAIQWSRLIHQRSRVLHHQPWHCSLLESNACRSLPHSVLYLQSYWNLWLALSARIEPCGVSMEEKWIRRFRILEN